MVNFDKVAAKIFSILKGANLEIIMYTEEGAETAIPEDGRRFFVRDPNIMVTLDTENSEIKFNKNKNVEFKEIEGILKQIKNLASSYMLNSQVKIFGKEIEPKDYAYQAKQYKAKQEASDMLETTIPLEEASLSRMFGSKKTSYQTLESVRLVVKHRRAVDEESRGARSRQIHSIFIERGGERFRFPHNYLAGARAMARHLSEGGEMNDYIGNHIVEQTGNLIKLKEFYNYARRNRLINEDSEDIISIVKENVRGIIRELKKLQGVKTYRSCIENIQEEGETDFEDKTDKLKDMFTVRKFDERIEGILPLVNKMVAEKKAYRAKIEEQSSEAFRIYRKENVSEDDIMEFDSPTQKIGYRLKNVVGRALEENELSAFLGKLANRLIEGNELKTFETKIVRNVLKNIEIVEQEETEEKATDAVSSLSEGYGRKISELSNLRKLF